MIIGHGRRYGMSNYRTELIDACRAGRVDMNLVKRLVEEGAEINAQCDSIGNTALHYACESTGNGVIAVWYLIDNGADISAINDLDHTPLHTACQRNYSAAVMQLIMQGADLNPRGIGGVTPLIEAARYALNSTCVRLMIQAGADVNAADNEGRTPLMAGCQGDYPFDVVEVLINNGADVNAEDMNGETPLIYGQYNPEVVKLLKAAGAKR